MWIYNREICDYDWVPFENPKSKLPANVHQMNKNEAKMLRKLSSETGLSENELRQIKKYRKMLSEAQDEGETSTKTLQERYVNRLMKRVTKELKLAKEHPTVIARFKELLQEKKNSGHFPWFMFGL